MQLETANRVIAVLSWAITNWYGPCFCVWVRMQFGTWRSWRPNDATTGLGAPELRTSWFSNTGAAQCTSPIT